VHYEVLILGICPAVGDLIFSVFAATWPHRISTCPFTVQRATAREPSNKFSWSFVLRDFCWHLSTHTGFG